MAICTKCDRLDCKYISDKGYCTCRSLELTHIFIPTKKGGIHLWECRNFEPLESIEELQEDIKEWFKKNGKD